MNTHQLIAVVGLVAGFSGCGQADTATMSDFAQDLGRHLDALGSEQVAHSAEISAAADVGFIGPAELGHSQRLNDRMSMMNRSVGAMMSCADGRGSPFDAATFAGSMQDLRSECAEHSMLMLSAHDMETASAEEARHQQAVGKQMDKMRRQLNPMMGPESYSCSPCPSCGM